MRWTACFIAAAEGHAAFELVGDGPRDEVGVEFRRANLLDVDADAVAGESLQRVAEVFDLGAAAADDDAGLGGVDSDRHEVGVAVDLDPANRGIRKFMEDELAEVEVLVETGRVVLLGEPLDSASRR